MARKLPTVLGIDPGSVSPGFATSDCAGKIVHLGLEPPPQNTHFDIVAVEGQYAGVLSKYSLSMLSLSAGWLLGQARGNLKLVLTPDEWKNTLMRNGNRVDKTMFCNRVYRDYVAGDPRLEAMVPTHQERRKDVLDALGILQSVLLLIENNHALTAYKYPFSKEVRSAKFKKFGGRGSKSRPTGKKR